MEKNTLCFIVFLGNYSKAISNSVYHNALLLFLFIAKPLIDEIG